MPAQPSDALTDADARRYRRFLRNEIDEEALYRYLARYEPDPNLTEVFLRLADSERRHQAIWETRLKAGGVAVPAHRPSLRVRVLGYSARLFGSSAIVPFVTRMENAATNSYDDVPEAVAHGLPSEERSHARLFREIGDSRYVSASGVPLSRHEARTDGSGANALRAAVMGANDGLVSNLSLVMGVAGAGPGHSVVLLSGLAGLLAGALSMALGEWISVRSAAEALQRQREIEAEAFEGFPNEEEDELTLIYQAKGLSPEEARAVAKHVISEKDVAIDFRDARDRPASTTDTGSAWTAAIASLLTFAVGAVLPVLPWFVADGAAATWATVLMAGAGLFVLGAATSLFTGRGILFAGGRMVTLGLAAAAITFAVGSFIGVGASV